MVVVAVPSHTVWLARLRLTVGVGLTVIVAVWGSPTHVFAVGVTVMVDVTGAVVLLVAVKEAILLSVPLAAIPVVVISLVHV